MVLCVCVAKVCGIVGIDTQKVNPASPEVVWPKISVTATARFNSKAHSKAIMLSDTWRAGFY